MFLGRQKGKSHDPADVSTPSLFFAFFFILTSLFAFMREKKPKFSCSRYQYSPFGELDFERRHSRTTLDVSDLERNALINDFTRVSRRITYYYRDSYRGREINDQRRVGARRAIDVTVSDSGLNSLWLQNGKLVPSHRAWKNSPLILQMNFSSTV